MHSVRSIVPVLGLAGIILTSLATCLCANDTVPVETRHSLMAPVKSWGYQLQRLDVTALAASPFDLIVIDHAPDRVESVELLFRKPDIEALKRKPDGSRRVVLAYMSIGEAERYRFYWDDSWLEKTNCPAWLGPVNPQWAGNYPVQYWEQQWQSLIFGTSGSYVDRVLHAGFDGIYIDRADVYEQFKARPTARADMVQFMSSLIDHARSIKPESIVVLQNAEELLRNKDIRSRLDGAAKESLYFDADKGGELSPVEERQAATTNLRLLQRAGGKIMVVEYVDAPQKAQLARKYASRDGFLVHFTERTLATLNVNGPDQPPSLASLPPTLNIPVVGQASSAQLVRASPCG